MRQGIQIPKIKFLPGQTIHTKRGDRQVAWLIPNSAINAHSLQVYNFSMMGCYLSSKRAYWHYLIGQDTINLSQSFGDRIYVIRQFGKPLLTLRILSHELIHWLLDLINLEQGHRILDYLNP